MQGGSGGSNGNGLRERVEAYLLELESDIRVSGVPEALELSTFVRVRFWYLLSLIFLALAGWLALCMSVSMSVSICLYVCLRVCVSLYYVSI